VASLALASFVPLSGPVGATTHFPSSTILLYAGLGVGVVATSNPNTGCSNVYITTNYVRWRDITPPLRQPADEPKGQCLYVWTDATFLSPSDGWLEARNGGSDETLLRHTLDGGRTWVTQPGGETGSNGGWETISFVSAAVGWRQQFGMGSNGAYELQRTVDAGATWSQRSSDPRGWCVVTNDVFSSALVGFAYATWLGDVNPTHLWRTLNGGVSWSLFTLPTPASLPKGARGLYGAPAFSGANGTVAVDYPVAQHQAIYFYATHNGGLTWTRDLSPLLPIVVRGALTISPQAATETCTMETVALSGHAATVDAVNPSTWWILRPGPAGDSTRLIVTVDGEGVTAYNIKDLPSTNGQPSLGATNSEDALLTLARNGYSTTYQTSNSGVTWERVKLPMPAARTSATGKYPNCATSQLHISLGGSGAAMGHIGMDFIVKNVGTSTCELEGYPTVQMVAGSRRLVPSRITFGPSYTVPSTPVRIIVLTPGSRAGFLLGYADSTGYGFDHCPSAHGLRITPPGDLARFDLNLGRVEIQAYGGTVQDLQCGEISVSTVMTLAAVRRII
jgi:hypothetical protein